jgi:acetyl-CoA C-acetyltransferase
MTPSRSVVLATPVRTAIGTFGDSLKEVSAPDLGAVAIGAAVERAGLEPDEIGTEGGAIAHGHPIGATGAVLTTKLIHAMRRDGLSRGLVTLCIGGGQGIALAIDVLH